MGPSCRILIIFVSSQSRGCRGWAGGSVGAIRLGTVFGAGGIPFFRTSSVRRGTHPGETRFFRKSAYLLPDLCPHAPLRPSGLASRRGGSIEKSQIGANGTQALDAVNGSDSGVVGALRMTSRHTARRSERHGSGTAGREAALPHGVTSGRRIRNPLCSAHALRGAVKIAPDRPYYHHANGLWRRCLARARARPVAISALSSALSFAVLRFPDVSMGARTYALPLFRTVHVSRRKSLSDCPQICPHLLGGTFSSGGTRQPRGPVLIGIVSSS